MSEFTSSEIDMELDSVPQNPKYSMVLSLFSELLKKSQLNNQTINNNSR
jgi:hypothetical protein